MVHLLLLDSRIRGNDVSLDSNQLSTLPLSSSSITRGTAWCR